MIILPVYSSASGMCCFLNAFQIISLRGPRWSIFHFHKYTIWELHSLPEICGLNRLTKLNCTRLFISDFIVSLLIFVGVFKILAVKLNTVIALWAVVIRRVASGSSTSRILLSELWPENHKGLFIWDLKGFKLWCSLLVFEYQYSERIFRIICNLTRSLV